MGVLQFFDSLYREENFDQYEADLEKAVKIKIARLEKKIKEMEQALEKTASDSKKETLRKSIDKSKASISNWDDHLRDKEKLKKYYLKEWRTFRGSDHLPLWVELCIDFSGAYLDYLETL